MSYPIRSGPGSPPASLGSTGAALAATGICASVKLTLWKEPLVPCVLPQGTEGCCGPRSSPHPSASHSWESNRVPPAQGPQHKDSEPRAGTGFGHGDLLHKEERGRLVPACTVLPKRHRATEAAPTAVSEDLGLIPEPKASHSQQLHHPAPGALQGSSGLAEIQVCNTFTSQGPSMLPCAVLSHLPMNQRRHHCSGEMLVWRLVNGWPRRYGVGKEGPSRARKSSGERS